MRDAKSGPHPARDRADEAPGELAEAFFAAFLADRREHGAEAIAAMRGEKVADYVKLAAALAPKAAGRNRDAKSDPLEALSDAELDRAIREFAARAGVDIRGEAATGAAPGPEGAAGDER